MKFRRWFKQVTSRTNLERDRFSSYLWRERTRNTRWRGLIVVHDFTQHATTMDRSRALTNSREISIFVNWPYRAEFDSVAVVKGRVVPLPWFAWGPFKKIGRKIERFRDFFRPVVRSFGKESLEEGCWRWNPRFHSWRGRREGEKEKLGASVSRSQGRVSIARRNASRGISGLREHSVS